MDLTPASNGLLAKPRRRLQRLWDVLIAGIPFVVVLFSIYSIVRGMFQFLRGDESLVPVLWAIGAPILAVLGGLSVQILLVRWVSRRYRTDAYTAKDESSFL